MPSEITRFETPITATQSRGPLQNRANLNGPRLETPSGPRPATWFNIGWYAAAKAFESWTSSGLPSTSPPSGHTLVDIQSFVIS